ncbi:MAG: hypothetical protein PHG89_05160 [Gallionella sp.]|nr:hypothetical protein [Gallionella sp.]
MSGCSIALDTHARKIIKLPLDVSCHAGYRASLNCGLSLSDEFRHCISRIG